MRSILARCLPLELQLETIHDCCDLTINWRINEQGMKLWPPICPLPPSSFPAPFLLSPALDSPHPIDPPHASTPVSWSHLLNLHSPLTSTQAFQTFILYCRPPSCHFFDTHPCMTTITGTPVQPSSPPITYANHVIQVLFLALYPFPVHIFAAHSPCLLRPTSSNVRTSIVRHSQLPHAPNPHLTQIIINAIVPDLSPVFLSSFMPTIFPSSLTVL